MPATTTDPSPFAPYTPDPQEWRRYWTPEAQARMEELDRQRIATQSARSCGAEDGAGGETGCNRLPYDFGEE